MPGGSRWRGQHNMPECIVCRGEYTRGTQCPRCSSDNTAWEDWKKKEEKRGRLQGFFHFLELHSYVPAIIAYCALPFGLLGMSGPWLPVRLSVLVPVVTLTFILCLYITQYTYAERFALREEELLGRVKRGWRKRLAPEFRAAMVPVAAIALVMIFALLLVESEYVWKFAELLMRETPSRAASAVEMPAQEETADDAASSPQEERPSLRERLGRALPLISLATYALIFVAFAYSSSLTLARDYARQLNEKVPLPIFLREDLLTGVVQREAGRAVHRAVRSGGGSGAAAAVGAQSASRSWTWDEMERLEDGGIRLTAVVHGTKKEETLSGELVERSVSTAYVVEADPWGRIIKVARAER